MFWELLWRAVMPSVLFFIIGMFMLTLLVRYEQNRARNAALAKKRN